LLKLFCEIKIVWPCFKNRKPVIIVVWYILLVIQGIKTGCIEENKTKKNNMPAIIKYFIYHQFTIYNEETVF